MRSHSDGPSACSPSVSPSTLGTLWIENGVPVHPVHEVTIAGNLKSMFLGVQALGTDIDRLGAIHTGSVLIDEMTIAGG